MIEDISDKEYRKLAIDYSDIFIEGLSVMTVIKFTEHIYAEPPGVSQDRLTLLYITLNNKPSMKFTRDMLQKHIIRFVHETI